MWFARRRKDKDRHVRPRQHREFPCFLHKTRFALQMRNISPDDWAGWEADFEKGDISVPLILHGVPVSLKIEIGKE